MSKILVVDDSEVDRRLVGGLLTKGGDHDVDYAENGDAALAKVRGARPDLIVTDLQMPERDGLELTTAIRLHYPEVPVILVTAHGSEALAVEALEQGAASYVPKSQLADLLAETVDDVLSLSRADRSYAKLIDCLRGAEFTFSLTNDPELIDPLVDLAQQMIAGIGLCDVTDRFRVGVALRETLLNALHRGNLEISAQQAQQARGDTEPGGLERLVRQRCGQAPYSGRKIFVDMRITGEEARFVIRDEGPGFDTASLPASADLSGMDATSGRGLVLMRSFMDNVSFNGKGNEVTLVKRKSAR